MLQSIILLAFLLHPSSGFKESKLRTLYADTIKIKCDALPYRTVYLYSNCYFVIDAEIDMVQTTTKCNEAFAGAKFLTKTPEDVHKSVLIDKSEFMNDGESTGNNKKAMCVYDGQVLSADMTGVQKVETQSSNVTSLTEGSRTAKKMLEYKYPASYSQPFTFQKGQTFVVKGISLGSDQVAIGFNTGNIGSYDIAFYINFRFFSGYLVLNSCLGGCAWGWEQISSNPLKQNQPFEVRVTAHENHFQIFLDQIEIAKYNYRTPLESIKYMQMWIGDYAGNFYSVDLEGRFINLTTVSDTTEGPITYELPTYYSHPIKVQKGQAFVVKGISLGSQQVAIAFNTGSTSADHDIVFYINFRFFNGNLVLNSCLGGCAWGWEQISANPLKQNQPFEVRVIAHEDHFQLFVDQNEIAKYQYRRPLDSIKYFTMWIADNAGKITYIDLGEKYIPIPSPSARINDFTVCKLSQSNRDVCQQTGSNRSALLSARGSDCKSLFVSGKSYDNSRLGGSKTSTIIDILLKNGDIALRFTIHFEKGNVALNSAKNGKWGTEQIESLAPFKRNEPFEVVFTAEQCAFQIFVNGKHYTTFTHRIPPIDIAKVRLDWVYDLDIQIK